MYSTQRFKSNNNSFIIFQPENILFDSREPDANLKVIDFGASEKMIDSSALTKKIGTPYYVAPEVLSEPGYDE